MMTSLRRILPIVGMIFAATAHGQYLKAHNASVSVGATGDFSKIFSSAPTPFSTRAPLSVAGTYPVTASNQNQYTTNSAGLLISMQIHPLTWAGVEFNYGFTHYQERYTFNYINTATPTALQQVQVPTDRHEATAAYIVHPRHIPLQPYFGIGGGAIDFAPSNASNQWRGAGLAEVGLDVPVHMKHIGFRVGGRSLFYRSPNFYQPAISTRSWRVTAQPTVSAFYRF